MRPGDLAGLVFTPWRAGISDQPTEVQIILSLDRNHSVRISWIRERRLRLTQGFEELKLLAVTISCGFVGGAERR
ncbi:hypothetical protein ASPWEDRAFT_41192 [Aspergillus wentii DTO 134E9]|uniref:Uncharacterized protein n=1 Tax=Aspergillus wentii DTO 134E9 TaxID=1073089 RepID=A0A1L9RLZ0_ASPWE|nr:uncharacterized protein ASPWEDRAFT_41192 [Aspergillus wentii DTO 134E9]OJJ35970.1 hypothetical protein ASPWEDRAFT_41192 [Aspergillus wentii DTO 134E9]